ncbi:hypothetical protein D3C71_1407960 [compost metagenome]
MEGGARRAPPFLLGAVRGRVRWFNGYEGNPFKAARDTMMKAEGTCRCGEVSPPAAELYTKRRPLGAAFFVRVWRTHPAPPLVVANLGWQHRTQRRHPRICRPAAGTSGYFLRTKKNPAA